MAVTDDEIYHSMYTEKDGFPWEEIRDEEAEFFSAQPSKNKYLLIEHAGEIVGVLSHTHNKAPKENMELDIWLNATKHTNKGIGSESLKLLIDYLRKQYNTKTFIIRPWIKNRRAVRAYEKAGFKIVSNFNPAEYYTKYLEEYGDGDYGPKETANMVLTF